MINETVKKRGFFDHKNQETIGRPLWTIDQFDFLKNQKNEGKTTMTTLAEKFAAKKAAVKINSTNNALSATQTMQLMTELSGMREKTEKMSGSIEVFEKNFNHRFNAIFKALEGLNNKIDNIPPPVITPTPAAPAALVPVTPLVTPPVMTTAITPATMDDDTIVKCLHHLIKFASWNKKKIVDDNMVKEFKEFMSGVNFTSSEVFQKTVSEKWTLYRDEYKILVFSMNQKKKATNALTDFFFGNTITTPAPVTPVIKNRDHFALHLNSNPDMISDIVNLINDNQDDLDEVKAIAKEELESHSGKSINPVVFNEFIDWIIG